MAAPLEPFYTLLGRRIRDLRISRGITQEDLGSRLTPPMTRASVANIELAKQRVYIHTLIEIAQILDTSITDLLLDPSAPPAPTRPPTLEKFASELAQKLPLKLEQVRELTHRIGYAQTGSPVDLPPRGEEEEDR
ncbi:MAG TPA: helix-turn-helix transcriptional regulator [Polyangiaceae bacterium]|jgi:transcriptional regulator with XRE-family HTH domain|nr:helix-turn-helix transcriptional regulator [Polyangiaceae bacterium]